MGDQIIYLEKYIDSTTSLPAELNRILNSIKDLDERSDDLAAQIQENVETVLKLAPASASASGGASAATRGKAAAGADGQSKELLELRQQIDKDQQLLIQFAEEKVQLAVQGYDLLEQHLAQADLDIVHLEAELTAMGMGDTLGGMSMGGPDYSGGTFDEPAPKRGGSRLRDVPSFDSFEQAAAAAAAPPAADPKPRKITLNLNLSRQISGFEPAAASGEAQTPGVDSLGAGASLKRPPSTAPRKATTPVPQAPVAPPSEGYQRNRRAAAAGVHAVAAEVAAMEEDDMAPDEQPAAPAVVAAPPARQRTGGAGGGPHAMQGVMMQQQQAAMGMPGLMGMPGGGGPGGVPGVPAHLQGRTSAEVARMFSEREPLIPGLNHAADRPQAPGKLISYSDINTGLIGRHAELYWPDDNLWYLILVKDFDPVTRKASIIYTTGEEEVLGLDEVVKDGHMSLINQQR